MQPEIPVEQQSFNDPAFLAYLRTLYPDGPVTPDPQDYDVGATADTQEEQARQYRLACAGKVVRLYRQWKAEQSREVT
jgi:hypothetical protein